MKVEERSPSTGMSSEMAIAVALEIGVCREIIDKTAVAIPPYFAERHLSTVLIEGLD